MNKLYEIDREIFEAIEAEKKRQNEGIELIASENFVSEAVLEAAGSIMTNKYAEVILIKDTMWLPYCRYS